MDKNADERIEAATETKSASAGIPTFTFIKIGGFNYYDSQLIQRCKADALLTTHLATIAEQAAEIAELRAEVANLRAGLLYVRDEYSKLPHSFGYDFTHLPRIDAALASPLMSAVKQLQEPSHE